MIVVWVVCDLWIINQWIGFLQRIQVERLTVSVVAFVVTVELITLQGKMTDVAMRE